MPRKSKKQPDVKTEIKMWISALMSTPDMEFKFHEYLERNGVRDNTRMVYQSEFNSLKDELCSSNK